MDHSHPNASLLRVENVTKRFRQGATVVEAVKSASLAVEPGQWLGVMGASGSGKSTLLHLIAGLTRPDDGQIFVDGVDLTRLTDHQLTLLRRRRIGLVFQAFNLVPTLTVEDNILLPALADGRERRALNARLQGLLERLGLAALRRRVPDALSGGEQQRVALARAMICEPAILLADEPTGSLDSVTGQDICRLLRQLCDEEATAMVVVTHDPAVATNADRIAIVKDGQLMTEIQADEFHDAPSLALRYQEVLSTPDVAEVV